MVQEGDALKERLLFPFDSIRDSQRQMLLDVESCLKDRKHLIVHAPTGLGKTIATLGPALRYAKKHKKTVFFLTARHTQHLIAIETLRTIAEKFGEKITAVDIIGKKWMCLQPGVDMLFSNEFSEYCKRLVEDDKCEFYTKLKKSSKLTTDAKLVMESIKKKGVASTEDVIKLCAENGICPYYLSVELASDAHVVIADYYYMFDPMIRENFFRRTKKELQDAILIIDEGHNLGDRMRDFATVRLSSTIIKRAVQEAKKENFDQHIPSLVHLQDFLNQKAKNLKDSDEIYVKKEDFMKHVGNDWDQLVADLSFAGEDIRERRRQSYLGSIAFFLELWDGPEEGYSRILSVQQGKYEQTIVLSNRCLDPALYVEPVLKEVHSAIIMSGTLRPTEMYRDLLGFPERTVEKSYESPFKQKNRCNIIIPSTTTKYAARSEKQYSQIAEICAAITNEVPGNTAIFFPSYALRDSVAKFFEEHSMKKTISERSGLTKKEKEELLERFKKESQKGTVLLAVASGSFGEGIDLPGDFLKAVIVVGLPLTRPDLETKALIDYFDKKFERGWDYGYLYPAFNRAIQSAGRCIRSETDKGVIVFLDERYLWRNYYSLFPEDWEFKITRDPVPLVADFFNNGSLIKK